MRLRALILPLLLSTAAPLAVHAQNMAPMTDRILSDPAFLPLKGQFYGETSYLYSQVNGENYDSTGAYFSHVRNVANNLSQYFAYGITDDLSLNFGISGDVSGYHRVDDASGERQINASGFYDPSFGLTWRAIDQRTHGLNLDLFGAYSPDVFSSQTGSMTQDATVARGGGEGDFGVAVSQENRFFTLRGDVTARYFGASTTTSAGKGADIRTSSFWAPDVGVETQVRFTPVLSANAGFHYVFNGSPHVFNAGTGIAHVNDNGDQQIVNVSLNYHVVPNKLVASVDYAHTFYDHNNLIYPADPASDVVQRRTEDSVGGTLRYLF